MIWCVVGENVFALRLKSGSVSEYLTKEKSASLSKYLLESVGWVAKVFVSLWCEADGYEHTQKNVCQDIARMCVHGFAELEAATC